MKWEELEEKPFAREVERARQVIANVRKATNEPTSGPVVIYEWEKWWKKDEDHKPQKIQITLDPNDRASVTRYENIAKHLEALVRNPSRHSQIRDTLKRSFEED